jgi:uncharacterized repeat protein (TIGR02543 family)
MLYVFIMTECVSLRPFYNRVFFTLLRRIINMLSKRFISLYGVQPILRLRLKLGTLFVVSVLLSLSVLSPVQAELQLFPPDLFTLVESQGNARLIIGLDISSSQHSGQQSSQFQDDDILEIPSSQRLDLQFQDNISDSYGNVSSNSGTDLTTIDYQRIQITQAQEEFLSSLGIIAETLFFSIPYLVVSADSSTLEAIYNSPLVTSIALDQISPPALSDSRPLTHTNTVWDKGYSGAGQIVAILDTGVDKTHPDLVGKVISEACYSTTYSGYNATSLCPIPDDNGDQVGEDTGINCDSSVSGCGHGTHVAGIVAANGAVKGVAKSAEMIAIQIFSRFDNPTYCGFNNPCALTFTSDQIAGLEHVLTLSESGMTIAAVNMSIGGGGYDVCDPYALAVKSIIDSLRSQGIATIVASGNSYNKNGIGFPACISSAISVGATDKSDNVANYSNSAEILDLLAPGSDIVSTLPNAMTGADDGTSMACPHVAGAFAILKSAVPTATVDEILAVLKQTGEPILDSNGITKPRIDINEALKELLPDTPIISDIPDQSTEEDTATSAIDFVIGDNQSEAEVLTLTASSNNTLLVPDGNILFGGSGANRTVTITPVANQNGTATITITVSDGSYTADDTFDLTVNAVNDAPLLDNTKDKEGAIAEITLNAVNEDAGAPNGAVGTLVSEIVALTGNVTDIDNVNIGIALTATSMTNGSWHYTTDGDIWNLVDSVSDSNALLLKADSNTRLYFQANDNGTISDAMTFRVWDQSSGAVETKVDATINGGSTAFSLQVDTAAITIIAINDKPSFSASNVSVLEDSGAYNEIGWAIFNAGASNESGQSVLSYHVSGITNPSLFSAEPTIDNTGKLSFVLAANQSGTTDFDVTVQDDGGTANGGNDTSSTNTFTITVSQNDFVHSIATSTATLTENNSGKQTITFTVSRSGASGQTSSVDYFITGTATNGSDYDVGGEAGSLSGTINFGASDASKTITLDVLADTSDEPNETIQVTLSNASTTASEYAATIGTSSATTTVNDDDVSLLINEIDYEQPFSSNENEIAHEQPFSSSAGFIEIKNVSSAPINLDPYTVELYDGASLSVYETIDLPDIELAAGDYTVICANSVAVVNCDLEESLDFLQNSTPKAVALKWGTFIVDTMSYDGSINTFYTEGTGFGKDSSSEVNVSISRYNPDGKDTNDNSSDFSLRCITPGLANEVAEVADCYQLSIDDVSKAEGDSTTDPLQFTVSLSHAAPYDITVDYATADNTATTSDYAFTSGTLIFNAGDTSKTIDVVINGDQVDENDEAFYVNLSNVSVSATMTEAQGEGIITDDDDAGVIVTLSGGSPDIIISEPNGSDIFNIKLTTKPTADVIINLSKGSNECTLSNTSVTLTSSNWNSGVDVTVTAQDDSLKDGTQSCHITTEAATSSDAKYEGIDPTDVNVTVNDAPAFNLSAISANTTEGGGTASFTVALNTQPTAHVAFQLQSSDTTEGIITSDGTDCTDVTAPCVEFSTSNWDTPQTVIITGVEDSVFDGNITYVIQTHAAISTDDNYNALDPSDMTVINEDNDSAPRYVFTVEKTGNGTVTSSTGMDCADSACSQSDILRDTDITLIATPDAGYVFDGWSDDCSGTRTETLNAIIVFIDNNRTCTANFKLKPRTLTVTDVSHGTISSSPQGILCGTNSDQCYHEFEGDETIKLSAMPDAGWLLYGWKGDCDNTGGVMPINDATCSPQFVSHNDYLPINHIGGNGTIISQQAGSDCGVACEANSWGGDCTNNDSSVLMDTSTSCVTLSNLACSQTERLYVMQGATGLNTGCNWTDAFTDLQTALRLIAGGYLPGIKEIWVAKGTYKPTEGTDRFATFQLLNGVGIYGGFAGIETQREKRDSSINPTVLSGDIGIEDDNADNSLHVVFSHNVDETAILDGVIIRGGNANKGDSCPDACGGGIYNDYGSPTLDCVLFIDNSSVYGGGMYSGNDSHPTVEQCYYENNFAQTGAAFLNDESSTIRVSDDDSTTAQTTEEKSSTTTPGRKDASDSLTPITSNDPYYDCSGVSTLNRDCNADGRTMTELKAVKKRGQLANAVIKTKLINHGWLSNVTITSEGHVSGGIATGYVKVGGRFDNFDFRGASVSGVNEASAVVGTLGGTIFNNSKVGGCIQDVRLDKGTHIQGGCLKGEIIGNAEEPALLEDITVKPRTILDNVFIGHDVKLPKDVSLGAGVQSVTQALGIDRLGNSIVTRSYIFGNIHAQKAHYSNGVRFSRRSVSTVQIKTSMFIESEHVGQSADILIVGYHKSPSKTTAYMRVGKDWKEWDGDVNNLQAALLEDSLQKRMQALVFEGDLGNMLGEFTFFSGYRLIRSQNIIYNGDAPLRFSVE